MSVFDDSREPRQLTRMWEGASSSARDRVSPTRAALVQAYATSQEAPRSPQMEEMLTMQPAFSWSIWGSTAWMVFRAPLRFTPR